MLQSVVTTGEATWSDNQLLVLKRQGFPEECYFSFSFSPVRSEDDKMGISLLRWSNIPSGSWANDD